MSTAKISNDEAYKLHLKSWKEAGLNPSKEELDELQFLYKVGKYAKKKKGQ